MLVLPDLGHVPVVQPGPFEPCIVEHETQWSDQVKARQAAESIPGYGEALFDQVFADRRAYDLMLLNPLLPDGNGLKLIPLLKRAWPQTRIVIVCASHSRALELATPKCPDW